MRPLFTHAKVSGLQDVEVLKVLTHDEARRSHCAPSKCLVWLDSNEDNVLQIATEGWRGFISSGLINIQDIANHILVQEPEFTDVISPGDVIRISAGNSFVSVLYRRGANSNTLFATERCNSRCLMCSQPPRQIDDQWRAQDMLDTIPLIDPDEPLLGISGGEPTLLGDALLEIILSAKQHLSHTGLHILSNGRLFSDEGFARSVCAVKHPSLEWGIPLYSDCPEIHDYIVQATGAWEQTLSGVYNLAKHSASIELRVVLQKENIGRLGELAYFIFRNLSFVKHVVFMGIEPIGYARANRERLWVAPSATAQFLSDAVLFLSNRGIRTSIYNVPLCMMPSHLRPFSHKSISDWKNVYLEQCRQCDLKPDCCGFFQSEDGSWLNPELHALIDKQSPVLSFCGEESP